MNIGNFDLTEKVFVVAEIGNNHEGDFGLAQELVARAADARVDAVKFQTFVPEHYVTCADAARLQRLRRFRLSAEQTIELASQANKLGLIFFSTPFDIESARFLDGIQPVFKIASGDNTFFPLVQTVAQFCKPLIISTGLADTALLRRLRTEVFEIWEHNNVFPGLAFLHCVASYPVPMAEANLGAISTLKERFGDCVIGYSDHTLGLNAATYAVAAGARIIEKHFTLDKNYSDFPDHRLSAEPQEMKQLVEAIRELSQLFGSGEKVPQSCENPLLIAARRSIAASRDLPCGTILTSTDLTWVRPGTGIPPGQEARLTGLRTLRPLKMGQLIEMADVERQ